MTTSRVLHIATRWLDAGSERNILHSMEWEQRAGYEVELATSNGRHLGPVETRFRIHRVRALRRSINPVRDLRALGELRRILRAGRYDIVHTHQSKAGILGRLAARRHPSRVVHTVHMASFGSGYGSAAGAAFRFAERRCASLTDVMVYVGLELRDQYLGSSIGTPESSLVIRSPVNLGAHLATRNWTDAQRRHARQVFGIPPDGTLLVAVGALTARKRPGLMVRQLATLLASAGMRLAVAGDGPEAGATERAARAAGVADRVHLLGHVDDVSSLIATADVFVHASIVEGVPQSVVQALAAARPVVATSVQGLREVEGARVRVVSPSGHGLADAVTETLRRPPEPVAREALTEWTAESIDRSIAALHERLQ